MVLVDICEMSDVSPGSLLEAATDRPWGGPDVSPDQKQSCSLQTGGSARICLGWRSRSPAPPSGPGQDLEGANHLIYLGQSLDYKGLQRGQGFLGGLFGTFYVLQDDPGKTYLSPEKGGDESKLFPR